MKQLRIFLLVVLFLQSKVGIAVNLHYCGEHFAEISWAFDVKGCGMEKEKIPTNVLAFSQKSCCHDDLIIAQDDTDQNIGEQVQIEINQFQIEPYPFHHFTQFEAKKEGPLLFHPPPSIRKHYRLNCAQIFYE